ncbi:ribbon-helix-helix protein, CopG family [Lacisediminihabitans profunda]|uniref:Ribbon-helix-helix protein, CopG family n=1 Tax=Lacisediminihabitans profunda TaxID=2594790 RepID=A0A5C8UPJ2_9MICO|nr:ribbon-helix-helix protein, CopG family [Lacisediminihabitans profunda]TXN29416.1 ribbon-helix-helix protein, CopG family [Lacisediminihabitans profunda]
MATNLRLRADAEAAVRAEAERSNRSQQDVIRAAIASYLHLDGAEPPAPAASPRGTEPAEGSAPDRLLPPRSRFARAGQRLLLPTSMRSSDLMGRTDRG